MLLASTPSDSYFKLIQHMLQESDNLYADSLTKQLGFIETQTGTYKQGVFAIKKILSKHTHLNFNTIDLSDGLGSRYNLATAEQMTILLADIYHNKTLYPQMLQALPEAGISGSLKARFKKTPLEKSVFAKTGTMHDISSLSGYIVRPNQHPLIFSILINGINQPISVVKKLEEDLLLLIP
jgi:D-alanyl-D-alanine carboxypeptidase/D-alanyl-D-alanine-endopeptidase (penicillin-binding protein 4)